MLAGLATQSLTTAPAQTAGAFAVAALIFVSLLVTAAAVIPALSNSALRPIRMTGPAVKRWSGYVLIGVGVWFLILIFLPGPIIGA